MVDPFSERKTGEESDWRWGWEVGGQVMRVLPACVRLKASLETLKLINSDSNRICEQNGQSRDL